MYYYYADMTISNNAITQVWCYVSHYWYLAALGLLQSTIHAVIKTRRNQLVLIISYFLKHCPHLFLISYILCVYSPTPCYTLPQLTFSRWHCKISQLPRACTHWGNTRVSCPAVRGACLEWAAGQVLYTHHYHGWWVGGGRWWVMGCHWWSELVIKVYQVWGGK